MHTCNLYIYRERDRYEREREREIDDIGERGWDKKICLVSLSLSFALYNMTRGLIKKEKRRI